MTGTVFAPMREEDLEQIATSERVIYPFPWSLTNFSDALASGYSCWVMRHEGILIAYGVVMVVLDETHLLNISVLPSSQRQGVGSRLLSFLQEQARQHGAAQMFLEVRVSNGVAHGFYLRRGFSEIGRRKAYYPAENGREDAIVMRCQL